MIGYLSGQVVSARVKSIVLNVNGVGYRVGVGSAISTKAAKNRSLAIFIYTQQTSDAISFFGFKTEKELAFFELLISVNGVGPKTALEILESGMEKVHNLIAVGDAKALAKTPGIGAKTAARIVLELKSKIAGGEIEVPNVDDIPDEVVEALESLGYKNTQIKKILNKIPTKITKTEEIVTWFLQTI